MHHERHSGQFGIVSLAHTLGKPLNVASVGEHYVDDVEHVQAWGYRQFHRAEETTGATDLAAEAGSRALAAADVPAADVDLVVLALSDIPEYLYWDAAAATQRKLAAHRAEAVLVAPTCGGGVAAFDLVAGKFATHPEYRQALIIGAHRVCEPYWNRMGSTASVYSDGAAAALVRRGHPDLRWLATEIITDGRYADFTRMDVGGAARPFAPGFTGPIAVRGSAARLDEFFDGDIGRILDFLDTVRSNSCEVVRRACARAGARPEHLARLIHFNDNHQTLAELAADLELVLNRLNVDEVADYGHVGCADQLITLQRQLDSSQLGTGDLVALSATGNGMHWMCTLLRV